MIPLWLGPTRDVAVHRTSPPSFDWTAPLSRSRRRIGGSGPPGGCTREGRHQAITALHGTGLRGSIRFTAEAGATPTPGGAEVSVSADGVVVLNSDRRVVYANTVCRSTNPDGWLRLR